MRAGAVVLLSTDITMVWSTGQEGATFVTISETGACVKTPSTLDVK